jgi:anti-anti-sigma factor
MRQSRAAFGKRRRFFLHLTEGRDFIALEEPVPFCFPLPERDMQAPFNLSAMDRAEDQRRDYPTPQPKSSLHVHITDLDRAVVVSVAGEASTDNLQPLEFALARLVARRVPLAVLDCSALTSLSSLAMGMLVSLRRDFGRWQGCVKLACVGPRIEQVLQATRLTELFQIHVTVEQALSSASRL